MCLPGAGWRVLARSSYGTLDNLIYRDTGAYLYQMAVMLWIFAKAMRKYFGQGLLGYMFSGRQSAEF